MNVTVGTFNLNNLFDRFNFQADLASLPARERDVRTTYRWEFTGQGTEQGAPPPQLDALTSSSSIVRIQRNANGTLLSAKPLTQQSSVASRIAAINVDVLAVQEVENIDSLRRFNRDLLDSPYQFELLLEGNDPRFIDVGVLSRYPLTNLTSHRFERHPDEEFPIFGRDLLEVDVMNATGNRRLFKLFVNHLKSKFVPFDAPDPEEAQMRNNQRRRHQAETVFRIVDRKTRRNTSYIVLGDMNDSPEASTLRPMIDGLDLTDALSEVVESANHPRVTNPEDTPNDVRWTHRFSVSNAPDQFELIDQIWVSRPLSSRIAHAEIQRRPRWSASSRDVGSDHDPVWVEIEGF